MRVELPPRLEAGSREKVESGEYADTTAVIAVAIGLLAERGGRQKVERLRGALRVGIVQIERGEVVGWTPTAYEGILENARRKAREGKRPKADVLP